MSKKILVPAIAAALATPVAGLAQPPQGVIIQSAERVAVGVELQSGATRSWRSRSRTWAGMIMIAGGAVLMSGKKETVRCTGGDCVSETERYKALVYPGVGLAVTGVLLATVWSDVPANPHIDFAVTPGRIQVGKTFGF
ncbi:MAG: hypothetical protein OXG35_11465 [Acidobacteria bacterium]|nr:hypothetical protein [Acidobacteriota bacterium]